MNLHRLSLAGLVMAGALAGCRADSSKARDAAVADGPSTDLRQEDSGTAANDTAPPRNDAAPTADEPVTGDARDRDASVVEPAPDLRPADLPGTPDQAATERPAAETPAADKPGADVAAADEPRPEAGAAEKPGADAFRGDGSGDASSNAGGDAGCTGWTTLVRLKPADAKQLIDTSDPIVINVHIPYEGDIPGTDTSIPYNNVDAIEKYLNYDHCADVLLVCKSGGMSQTAGNELIKRGYLRIRDLDGGMIAWESAGYPLLKDGGT
jgi:rhodanese-related sulfurtransferase